MFFGFSGLTSAVVQTGITSLACSTIYQGPGFSRVFEADSRARKIENDAFHGHFTG